MERIFCKQSPSGQTKLFFSDDSNVVNYLMNRQKNVTKGNCKSDNGCKLLNNILA
jgi:hypothetical protein